MATTPSAGKGLERRAPVELGLDPERLDAAIAFIKEHEAKGDHHTRVALDLPDNEIVGPLKDRGGHNGMILRRGAVAAEWGDIDRVDMTYSISKSYLSTVAGLAFDRGMIPDLDERVSALVPTAHFSGEHNGQITWRHLLQQTSEWTGTLWGKRDIADRRKGVDRAIQTPGTFYEYNDVRINRFGQSLLRVHGQSVPDVFRREVMDVVGASNTWRWIPYHNSYVDVNGKQIASVSGGTRWGGGVWINAQDMARFGYLWLRGGRWGEKQVLPPAYVKAAISPSQHGPDYGYLWWLNTQGKNYPGLPPTAYGARGAGSNTITILPDQDLVVVWRWHAGNEAEFVKRVVAAIKPTSMMR